MPIYSITGNIVDLVQRQTYPGTLVIENERIKSITPVKTPCNKTIIPGLIDAFSHIENTFMIPAEYARIAATNGIIASLTALREISRLLGIKALEKIIHTTDFLPHHFFYGASCFLSAEEIETLLKIHPLHFIETCPYSKQATQDPDFIKKLEIAKKNHIPIVGFTLNPKDSSLSTFVELGISSGMEYLSLQEAKQRIRKGMKILINEEALDILHPLVAQNPEYVMLCNHVETPQDIAFPPMLRILKKLISNYGYDPLNALMCACMTAKNHFRLETGLLQPSDPADFLVLDNLHDFNIFEVYVGGQLVAREGIPLFDRPTADNDMGREMVEKITIDFPISSYDLIAIPRNPEIPPQKLPYEGFNLVKGALAMTLPHQKWKAIALGIDAESVNKALTELSKNLGGIAIWDGKQCYSLPLPIAGLMTYEDGFVVAEHYQLLESLAQDLGLKTAKPLKEFSESLR